jgi:hypothetical protein
MSIEQRLMQEALESLGPAMHEMMTITRNANILLFRCIILVKCFKNMCIDSWPNGW